MLILHSAHGCHVVSAPFTSTDAVAVNAGLDIANAWIRSANTCLANTTASPASTKTARKPSPGSDALRGQVILEERNCEQGGALGFEMAALLKAIRDGQLPVASSEDGQRALEMATRIAQTAREGACA